MTSTFGKAQKEENFPGAARERDPRASPELTSYSGKAGAKCQVVLCRVGSYQQKYCPNLPYNIRAAQRLAGSGGLECIACNFGLASIFFWLRRAPAGPPRFLYFIPARRKSSNNEIFLEFSTEQSALLELLLQIFFCRFFSVWFLYFMSARLLRVIG